MKEAEQLYRYPGLTVRETKETLDWMLLITVITLFHVIIAGFLYIYA